MDPPEPRLRAWWLPPEVVEALGLESPGAGAASALSLDDAVQLCRWLKARRARQLERSALEIAGDLGRVSERWLEQRGAAWRAATEERVAAETGYPRPMIARSLDHFFQAHSGAALASLLRDRFGEPSALDGFRPSVAGRSRAFGPAMTLLFASGNVPVAPLATIYHSLLVKSPCVARAPSGSPSMLTALARSIWETEPALGACVAVLGWDRGNREMIALLASQADAVVTFGSDATLESIRADVPPHVRFVGHGHRLGFGVIGREGLEDAVIDQTAAEAAVDVAAFDQQGCMSPHWFYVEEGGEATPEAFAARLAATLERLQEDWPRRALSPPEASAIHQARATWEVRPDARVWRSAGTEWTVIYTTDDGPDTGPLNRFVFVKPVPDATRNLPLPAVIGRHLQTVTCALAPERLAELAARLGQLGVTRLCPLGRAQEPLAGHHDGRDPLADLVRWVDVE